MAKLLVIVGRIVINFSLQIEDAELALVTDVFQQGGGNRFLLCTMPAESLRFHDKITVDFNPSGHGLIFTHRS